MWELLAYERPDKEMLKGLLRKVKFYADHNLDRAIIEVLRRLKYDIETAREIGAEYQPDQFHYRHAFTQKRVLLTLDKDYLDNGRFPLSQTHGVVIFNIDTSNPGEIARALEVVDAVLAVIAPMLDESKVVLNADYTLTFIGRYSSNGGFVEERTRYRLDANGQDVYVWTGP